MSQKDEHLLQFTHQDGLTFEICREIPKMLTTVAVFCDHPLFIGLPLPFGGLMHRIRSASLLKELDIHTDEKPMKYSRLHFQNPDLNCIIDSVPSRDDRPGSTANTS